MARRNPQEPEQRVLRDVQAQRHGKGSDFAKDEECQRKERANSEIAKQNFFTRKQMMEEARKSFEAVLAAKGKEAPHWDGLKYDNINIQTYWRWFLLGWTIKTGSNK